MTVQLTSYVYIHVPPIRPSLRLAPCLIIRRVWQKQLSVPYIEAATVISVTEELLPVHLMAILGQHKYTQRVRPGRL